MPLQPDFQALKINIKTYNCKYLKKKQHFYHEEHQPDNNNNKNELFWLLNQYNDADIDAT